MFGNLFDEADAVYQGCAPNPNASPKINGKDVEAPPPYRGETNFCGIKNQGATCYLNSLIQTLLLTPEFREELFRLGPDELGKLEDLKKKKVRKIPIQLQMLLARLLLLNQYACSTEGLTESFGWVDSEELQQHDVQELSRILFCAIEDSLVGTSGHDIIKNLYRGVTANQIACLSCGNISERIEEFLDLNIAIATRSNLTSVLRDMFVETELMNGKNQYHCSKCAKLVDARKGAVIRTLPPILTVSLLRFSFDYTNLRRYKEFRKFDFPLTLHMKPYCEQDSDSASNCYDYDLYSVIIHSGSAHGGHYHAYIRDIDGLGTAPADYNPTPKKVTPPSPNRSDTLTNDFRDDPYELLVFVLGKLGGENVPLTKLNEAFREEIDSSWAKQYKKKYGTMVKFIQSCHDTFVVDTRAKTVSFRASKNCNNFPSDSNSYATASEENVNVSSDASGDSVTCNGNDAHGTTDFVPQCGEGDGVIEHINGVGEDPQIIDGDCYHPLCNVWFDFNDSHVKTITTHDIENQFEGRESAYMLFYRRKDLRRPLESLGNSLTSIPDHIKAQIQEENCSLDELRNEYDNYLNVVTVKVFFPSMFKRENGLIKFCGEENNDDTDCGFSYSIDRRKNIADMITELIQMAEKHEEVALLNIRPKLQCNIVKTLSSGGIHIYDRVDADGSVTIGDSILENGLNLILWGGVELLGSKVTPGVANEPIVLDVHCKVLGGSNIQSFKFKGVSYGNVIVNDLHQYFLEKFKMKHVVSSKFGKRGRNNELEAFSEDESQHWLSDVIKSSDEALVEITLDDADTENVDSDSDFYVLDISPGEAFQAQLHENGHYGSPHDVFILLSISGTMKVSSFIFVTHLKSMILQWLFPDIRNKYKLNDFHLYSEKDPNSDCIGASKLCLHEQQSLSQAGLCDSVSLKLELGPPPDKKEFHVTVYIQKGCKVRLPVKKSQAVQFLCTRTHTVTSFIDKIMSKECLTKDSRHLRLLKSQKELGEIISSPERLVEQTLIRHGSVLVLCPGSVPSDGRLRILIWFYPKSPTFDDLLMRLENNPTLSPWSSFFNVEETEPISVGYIETEKDANLFDLKQEIVKLDFFQNEDITDVEEICLRSIHHKIPTRFHLEETSSVKRLRLGPTMTLAVQRSSAVPKNDFTLVHITFQTPGTRLYTNSCEKKVDKSAPLAQLYVELSKHFDIPIKDLLIARRGEEFWDWEIIKSKDCDKTKEAQKSNGKGKRGSKQKKSQGKAKNKKPVGKALVLPQDGDVLRVKHIQNSNIEGGPEVADFKSDEEAAAWKRWQESKPKESSNSQSPSDDVWEDGNTPSPEEVKKTSKPKKEETLRIHVDKF